MEEADMDLVFAKIELLSGDDLAFFRRGQLEENQIHRCTLDAMLDSGATMLAIPEFVKKQLDLLPVGRIQAELADGSSTSYEVVGPIEVRFQNRRTVVEALVVPGSTRVLLGAIPMEGMDVLVDPKRERLLVNPESPNVAKVMLR
jgi:clan AA aspartic protease